MAVKLCLERNPNAFHPKIGEYALLTSYIHVARFLLTSVCLVEPSPIENHFLSVSGKYKPGDKERRHTKGCNCKRSGCLKNYCECYEARILCSGVCRCVGCHNIEENMDAESLLTIKQDFKVGNQLRGIRFRENNFEPIVIGFVSIAINSDVTSPRFQYRAPKSKFDETLKQLAGVGEAEKLTTARTPPPKPELKISSELIDATCECLLSRASEASEEGAEKAILQEFGHCLAAIIEAANLRVATKVK